MTCPSCDSNEVATKRMVHASGTSHGTSRSTHVGHASAGAFSATVTYRGTTHGVSFAQTRLAAACSPPTRARTAMPLLILLAPFVVGAGNHLSLKITALQWSAWSASWAFRDLIGAKSFFALGFLALFVLGVLREVTNRRYNKSTYPMLLQRWYESWICLRCGAEFKGP